MNSRSLFSFGADDKSTSFIVLFSFFLVFYILMGSVRLLLCCLSFIFIYFTAIGLELVVVVVAVVVADFSAVSSVSWWLRLDLHLIPFHMCFCCCSLGVSL